MERREPMIKLINNIMKTEYKILSISTLSNLFLFVYFKHTFINK